VVVILFYFTDIIIHFALFGREKQHAAN